MSTISSFEPIKRGKDCIRRFGESLRYHAMEIINLMKLLTNEQQTSYQIAKMWYICKENSKYKHSQDEKVTNHCHCTREYRGAAHGICNFKYSIPKNFPIVFHNGSDYDHHFIMKELPEEFEKQLTYLGENTKT